MIVDERHLAAQLKGVHIILLLSRQHRQECLCHKIQRSLPSVRGARLGDASANLVTRLTALIIERHSDLSIERFFQRNSLLKNELSEQSLSDAVATR